MQKKEVGPDRSVLDNQSSSSQQKVEVNKVNDKIQKLVNIKEPLTYRLA